MTAILIMLFLLCGGVIIEDKIRFEIHRAKDEILQALKEKKK